MVNEELQRRLNEAIEERDKLRAALIDARLEVIEGEIEQHRVVTKNIEGRLRPLEDGQIKANTIYTLFAGNSLLSIIALIKIFLA